MTLSSISDTLCFSHLTKTNIRAQSTEFDMIGSVSSNCGVASTSIPVIGELPGRAIPFDEVAAVAPIRVTGMEPFMAVKNEEWERIRH